MDALTRTTAQLSRNLIPDRPFLVLGQYSSFEPSRAPEGKECAWAYTHIPQDVKGDAGEEGLTGRWDERETELFADRMEEEVERLAPGFRDLIRKRHIYNPQGLERSNRNLVGGALNSGTAQIHQQLIFRPTPGTGRAETPLPGLFLAGSSAHPGGGVHGAAGANAARAAVAERMRKRVTFAAGAAAGAVAVAGAVAGGTSVCRRRSAPTSARSMAFSRSRFASLNSRSKARRSGPSPASAIGSSTTSAPGRRRPAASSRAARRTTTSSSRKAAISGRTLSDAKLSLQGSKYLRPPRVDLLGAQRTFGVAKGEAPSNTPMAWIDPLPGIEVEQRERLEQLAGRAPNDTFDFRCCLVITDLQGEIELRSRSRWQRPEPGQGGSTTPAVGLTMRVAARRRNWRCVDRA
jgi:hypothetical protein